MSMFTVDPLAGSTRRENNGIEYRVRKALADNPDLFDGLSCQRELDFYEWLPGNFHVIDAFERVAKKCHNDQHRERYSIYYVREQLRWDTDLKERGREYKLNNNRSSFTARLVMAMNPSLKGMFKIRGKPDEQKHTDTD